MKMSSPSSGCTVVVPLAELLPELPIRRTATTTTTVTAQATTAPMMALRFHPPARGAILTS